MKQLDYETSNYKHKEEIKGFVNSFNELADKYVKSFENSDTDLKKVTSNIEKKNASIQKLEENLLDLNNKTAELVSLKEVSNEEIKTLNAKKSEISFTDSEVQKMELDDINSQISAKKGKIAKIDAKIEATRAKVKAGNEEKRNNKRELSELEKNRAYEEEALFRTQSLVSLVQELKDQMNSRALEIVNSPYRPKVETQENEINITEPVKEEKIETREETIPTHPLAVDVPQHNLDTPILDEITLNEDISILDFDVEEIENSIDIPSDDVSIEIPIKEEEITPIDEKKEEKPEIKEVAIDSLIKDKFKKEGIDVAEFSDDAKEKMSKNKDAVINNMEILKKHGVPLEYTLDQPEIYYDINSQDLEDLLSIITTDDEGNGMGFTIDFTFNILSELSKIDVDKLIDVYNDEFMNVNAKSGIIYLLKQTNPSLVNFAKNREANIKILRDLGANTVDEIIEKHPEFVDMDNPLFVNVINVFDKSDLVDKLNSDVDVVTKIIDYWKNN